ncbi:hypothetical protein LXL04_038630 [Taraxacum kok-saghyz]
MDTSMDMEIVSSPDSGGCAALVLVDGESEGFIAPEDGGYAPIDHYMQTTRRGKLIFLRLHLNITDGYIKYIIIAEMAFVCRKNTPDLDYVKRQETWTPLVDVKPYKGD